LLDLRVAQLELIVDTSRGLGVISNRTLQPHRSVLRDRQRVLGDRQVDPHGTLGLARLGEQGASASDLLLAQVRLALGTLSHTLAVALSATDQLVEKRTETVEARASGRAATGLLLRLLDINLGVEVSIQRLGFLSRS
jgi:hypothetical protein